MAKTADHLVQRHGTWYYSRRVPRCYTKLDPRRIIHQSTAIRIADDPLGRRASEVARRIDEETRAYWQALADGSAPDAALRYKTAIARARHAGLPYRPAVDLAVRESMDDLALRLGHVEAKMGDGAAAPRPTDRQPPCQPAGGRTAAGAYLGGEAPPSLQLSGLVEAYTALAAADLADMSHDQRRRHLNGRRRAVAVAIAAIGDMPLDMIDRSQAQMVRASLAERAIAGAIKRDTGTKVLHSLQAMWHRVNDGHQLGLAPIWAALKIGRSDTGQRVPAAPDHAQMLLRTNALSGLNAEARGILWLVMDTGARPSEIAALGQAAIRLDDTVPHMVISSALRPLKVAHTARSIPLAGLALAALRAHPHGFPRYFDKTPSWSALINKGLRGVAGWPDGVTAYSFRHLFKDRLRAVGAPDSVMNALMGHKDQAPAYGAGYSLSALAGWVNKIAFIPPTGWCP